MTEPEAASTDPIVRPEADQGIEPAATPMQQAQEPAETRHVETPREEPLAVESIPEQHGVQKGDEPGVHATNSPGRVENVEQSPPKEADASSEGAVAAPPSERVQTALERAAAAGKEWRPPVSDTTAVLARAAAAGKEWRPPVPAAPVDPRPSLPPMKIITQKDWLMRTAPTLARAGLYNLNDMELATLLVTRNVPNVGTQISAPLLPSTSDPHGRCIAIVEFKRKRLRKYDAARDVLVGSHVMVDSDRGTDIGLVVRVIRLGADGHITLGTLPNADIPLDKLIQTDGRLIREARPEEIHALYSWLPLLEQQALNAVRLRSKYHKLDIALVDCEFQFDGKKVTFFFDAEPGTVIDFRDLVRDMYALYKARIWMENINPKGPKMNAADGSPEKPEADSAPS